MHPHTECIALFPKAGTFSSSFKCKSQWRFVIQSSRLQYPAISHQMSISLPALLHRPNAWCEITSLGEKAARVVVKREPGQFVLCNSGQTVRTYPAGTRVDSSNYNPVVCGACIPSSL